MARIIQLETDIYVASQLAEGDLAQLAARGFRSVVNNRPDGEAPDQWPSAEAEAAALRHGLVFRHLPATNLNVTDDELIGAFGRLMDGLPRPILFYCRSGTRCTILWAQAAVARLGVERVLAIAADAGFELQVLRETLHDRAGAVFDAETPSVRDMLQPSLGM